MACDLAMHFSCDADMFHIFGIRTQYINVNLDVNINLEYLKTPIESNLSPLKKLQLN